MTTTHPACLSPATTSGPRGRRLQRRLTRALGAGRRLAAALGRRLRPPAPPAWSLSDHLRRDIGLHPVSELGRWRHRH